MESQNLKKQKDILTEEIKRTKKLFNQKREQWFETRWRMVNESKDMPEWWAAVGKFRTKRKRAGQERENAVGQAFFGASKWRE